MFKIKYSESESDMMSGHRNVKGAHTWSASASIRQTFKSLFDIRLLCACVRISLYQKPRNHKAKQSVFIASPIVANLWYLFAHH